jgi:hypothetical protein
MNESVKLKELYYICILVFISIIKLDINLKFK